MLEGRPVAGLPEEIIEEKLSVIQLLCERYTGTPASVWSKLVGRIMFATLLSMSGDCRQYKQVMPGHSRLAESREELKYHVKNYLMLTLRAYLEIRRSAGERADTVES